MSNHLPNVSSYLRFQSATPLPGPAAASPLASKSTTMLELSTLAVLISTERRISESS